MIDYEKRNLEVLRMRKEGKNLRQLSSRFGISVERIGQGLFVVMSLEKKLRRNLKRLGSVLGPWMISRRSGPRT